MTSMRRLALPLLVLAVGVACTTEDASHVTVRRGTGSGSSSGGTSSSSSSSGSGGSSSGGSSSGADAAPKPKGCAGGTYLFCDDFESYETGPATSAKWESVTASASDTLTIDTTHARSGKALHVHVSQNEFAFAKLKDFAPPDGGFYGRVHVWVNEFPSAPDYAHFTLVEAAGDPGSAGVLRPLGGQYDPETKLAAFGVGSDGGPTGDWTNWKTTAPAKGGSWLCLEWQMRTADSGIDVWIDSVAKPELGVTRTSHGGNDVDLDFPKWSSLWFGWWLYQGGPTPDTFDLWYDDVALSTSRIGCD